MTSVQALFLALFGLNVLTVLVLFTNEYSKYSSPVVYDRTDIASAITSPKGKAKITKSNPYSFDEPLLALKLLEKLDVYSQVSPKLIPGLNLKSRAEGLIANNNYCNEHRAYFVEHPELVFQKKLNFITNYWGNHGLRTNVIPKLGKDLHPEIRPGGKVVNVAQKIDANIFFTRNLFFFQRLAGKQFSCLSQASNHIPGHEKMYRKDYAAQALVDYSKKYNSRPECFSYDKYFPKTWVMQKKDQCLDFFKGFNSPDYQKLKEQRNVVYFRKIGANAHEGHGVFPIQGNQETYVRKLYNNGELCGKVRDNNLMQTNVWNPLLLENRKFGFRMFMLVASTNPVIAYYHDGYLRLSIDEYNPNSKETRTFVTNIGVNLKEALKDTAFAKMTSDEIQEWTCWSLEEMNEYVNKNGIVQDPDWVNNHLRPQFKKVMIHLIRMGQGLFFKGSSVFELFGLDFVMDADLGLWFIEANTMPLITGFTKRTKVMMNQMLTDTFEIVMGLTRSRMKRVIDYVNGIIKQSLNDKKFDPNKNLEQRRQKFKSLIANRFEPEFAPSPKNTFHLIIDENQTGVKRYNGLLESKCL